MRTHEHLAGTYSSRESDTCEPAADLVSQMLSAASPTSAIHDLLATLARDLDAPFVALYRVLRSASGEIELRVDDALTPEPQERLDLDALGADLIRHWEQEFSDLHPVVQTVETLPAELSEHLALAEACTLIAQPIRVGVHFVALLVASSRVNAHESTEAAEKRCEELAEAVAVGILRERSSDHARLNAVLAYAFDIISVVGPTGNILYHTPTFARVLGDATESFVGQSAFRSIHPDDQPRVAAAFEQLLHEPGGQRRIEVRLKHHNGSWRHFEALGTNQIDNPLIGGIVVTAYYVTDRRKLEEKLNWQALHDPLTRLANRSLLLNDLRRALARAQRSGNLVGILFLDLDQFKEVNDHFGHPAGDQLLIQIAERLLACVRAGETVARLGGDEFVVLLEGLTAEADAERAASRILDAIRMPVRLSHGNVDISASMGISLASGEPVDPDDLLIQADSALYRAKRAGRARFCFYQPD